MTYDQDWTYNFIDRMIGGTERKIAVEYRKARENIKTHMAVLYEKYETDGVLTYAEMSKYNRLNSMYSFLTDEINTLSGSQNGVIKTLVKDAYEESFYHYGYAIARDADVDINFGLLNRDTVASLINEPSVAGTSLLETLGAARYKMLLNERRAITQGLILGESYPKMARRITDEFNKSYNDAIRIARTEGARAAGEGQADSYDRAEELGIDLDRLWVATLDGRTRDAHGTLDGMSADKEGYFHYKGLKSRHIGGWGEAAMDVNCFPGDTYVITDSPVDKVYRRQYSGYLYEVTTASGDKITGTPNHPILTDKGWVPFNVLNEGDNLVCAVFNTKFFSSGRPDIQDCPTVLAKISNFFDVSASFNRILGATQDFHGDGEASNIDIIDIAGLLTGTIHTPRCQCFKKIYFKLANFASCFLHSLGSFDSICLLSFATTNRIVCFAGKMTSFFRSRIFHAYIHGFAHVSRFISTVAFKIFVNTGAADTNGFGKLLNRFSRFVALDKVIDIQFYPSHGMVYNLQTKNNKYYVNNLAPKGNIVKHFIVHNCRCRIIAQVQGTKPSLRRTQDGVGAYQTYDDWKEAQKKKAKKT